MHRRVAVLLLVTIAAVLSACTPTEVQLWFRINQHRSISTSQATAIATVVNEHVPTGSVDVLGQFVNTIQVAGWAVDPDTSSSINVDVYDGATGTRVQATDPRPDVASIAPGRTTAHGFHLSLPATPGVHHVCVYAINDLAGFNPVLACKDIDVLPIGTATSGSATVTGLLEGLDQTPTGVHIRGFIYSSDPSLVLVISRYASGVTGYGALAPDLTVARPDVRAVDPSAPAVTGFDYVAPADDPHPLVSLCIGFVQPGTALVTSVSCRDANT